MYIDIYNVKISFHCLSSIYINSIALCILLVFRYMFTTSSVLASEKRLLLP